MELECQSCAERFSPQPLRFECPQCGSRMVRVTVGYRLQLVGIDIEKEPRPSGMEAG